jgi:hypothetical protein
MKIRKGFVSNSSSSSFIVAVDPSVNPKGCVTIQVEVELSDMGRTLRNEQEVIKYCKEHYYSDDNEYKEKMLSTVKEGKFVIIGEFASDSDDVVERMLCDNGLTIDKRLVSGLTIIQNDAGY